MFWAQGRPPTEKESTDEDDMKEVEEIPPTREPSPITHVPLRESSFATRQPDPSRVGKKAQSTSSSTASMTTRHVALREPNRQAPPDETATVVRRPRSSIKTYDGPLISAPSSGLAAKSRLSNTNSSANSSTTAAPIVNRSPGGTPVRLFVKTGQGVASRSTGGPLHATPHTTLRVSNRKGVLPASPRSYDIKYANLDPMQVPLANDNIRGDEYPEVQDSPTRAPSTVVDVVRLAGADKTLNNDLNNSEQDFETSHPTKNIANINT